MKDLFVLHLRASRTLHEIGTGNSTRRGGKGGSMTDCHSELGERLGRGLTVKQAAYVAGVHPNVIYKMIRKGMLPAMKLDRNYRISPAVIEEKLRETHGDAEKAAA